MSESPVSVIVAGARTPLGRMLGSLKGFSGTDLGGVAIKGALQKAGVRGDQVDYVIMGQVLTAGAGQIPARQAAVKAGIPMSVPALSINKAVSYTHLRAHETVLDLVCRLLLEKK